MITYADDKVVICGPGPTRVIRDEKDGQDRWCFKCRKRREFRFIVTTAVDWEHDYYGPSGSIHCAVCHLTDGDCFPGRYRMWGEE
ncbi:hypothetical protein [Curtobacterium sp. MCBD17_030]|uniref:hypothetical protein n=1 Tax=Curtobacterium sp. MCBD17_030 TaxID=2175649 RepID=UPI000D980C04|nr:hypothetical protein [Curtobacterium sp. MCBD17_030]PYY32381.1 hypothetical protein DEI89_13190 [Curtobacterium sp. MCBD17_030]